MILRNGAKQSNWARWEQERQEEKRLQRLAEVRPVIQFKRPPRLSSGGGSTPRLPAAAGGAARPPPAAVGHRVASAEGSRNSSQSNSPLLVLKKPRARSASPGRLEPLDPESTPPLGPSLRPPAEVPAAPAQPANGAS